MWNKVEGIYQSFSGSFTARGKPERGIYRGLVWNEIGMVSQIKKLLKYGRKYYVYVSILIISILFVVLLLYEARTSKIQAWYFSSVAQELTFQLESGPVSNPLLAPQGPYDLRFGYTDLPRFTAHLSERGYQVTEQAAVSSRMLQLSDYGIYPVYHQKDNAGLTLLADTGDVMYKTRFPNRVYHNYDEIPSVLVETLLFIENRTLLEEDFPFRNPAIEWNRLGKAVMDKTLAVLVSPRSVPGGSTLATQLEKVRHSPDGLTENISTKGFQMLSASLRSYLDGPKTFETQKRIILNYINSVPLAAISGYGEVIGLGDGMWAWYGVDFDEYNDLLAAHPDALTEEEMQVRGEMYKRTLSLFLAHRRPSYFLTTKEGRKQLDELTNSYSDILYREGIIPYDLYRSQLQISPELRNTAPPLSSLSFIERKAVNAIRTDLLNLLRLNSNYDLDQLDLTVQTTFNQGVQESITDILNQLHDRNYIREANLEGYRLITGDPTEIKYAIVLYERTNEGNKLRVQADNFDGPLNINEGTKLELGSTAKLRALVSYLEIINNLYEDHSGMSPSELLQIEVPGRDVLTRWTLYYLANNSEATLQQVLEAAMERRYSANTGERFFTAGGLHTFRNFDATHEGQMLTVTEAFRHSVNLPFIRLMRDVVYHYAVNMPGNPTDILDNADDPRRQQYLSRFADKEGLVFLNQFYQKYRGLRGDDLLNEIFKDRNVSSNNAAWIFRSIRPDATLEEFLEFRGFKNEQESPSARNEASAFRRANIEDFNWQDRGYVARVHPLEVWLVSYLYQNPDATRNEWIKAGADVRQEVYEWLFRHRNKRVQDNRIWQIIEEDAFEEIHRDWQRVGYPFNSLVPSYATAIGTSADRPGDLAELVGIILNDGVRLPMTRIEKLHFAEGTPYETVMEREYLPGERVLSKEVSAVLRGAMVDVVEKGTARRVSGVMKTSAGELLPVGAKTGTGDNRFKVYGARGLLLDSKPLNRTSTLVFFIDDRFFGTVTVFVSGSEASGYGFTSSLPAQILRHIVPRLQPLFENRGEYQGADVAAVMEN